MPSQSEILFGGETLVLDASGALYWPARQLLVVSDLHLEKSTFLASHGSLIPPYDTQDTLERLEKVLTRYQPQELLLLGDSFHDRHAWERLDDGLRTRILRIRQKVARMSWIEGNHDRVMMSEETVQFLPSRTIGTLLFSHEPQPDAQRQIIGHYHPKMSVLLRNRHVRGRCFAHTERILVMPAFGSYTGGLDIQHAAFSTLTRGEALRVHLIYQDRLYMLPPPVIREKD